MFFTAVLCQAQVSETRKAGSFSKIEVTSGIELLYQETENEIVIKVEADNDADLNSIVTEIDGTTLKIYARNPKSFDKKLKVHVSAKDIESFKATSRSRIVFENKVTSKNIAIAIASGSYFKGYLKSNLLTKIEASSDSEFNGRIETDLFVGNFKSQSKINISGTAEKAILYSETKAYCNARNFLTKNTEVNSDNATVIITSSNRINISAIDNAVVSYFGSPKKVTIENESVINIQKYRKPSLVVMK